MATYKYLTRKGNHVTINQYKWNTEAVLTNRDGAMIMNNINIISWKVSCGSLLLVEGGKDGQEYSIELDLNARPNIILDTQIR